MESMPSQTQDGLGTAVVLPARIPRFKAKRTSLIVGLGLVVCLVQYSVAFDNGFRDDDFVFLQHAMSSNSLADLLSPAPNQFAFFRPGTLLLFDAEYELFGARGGWFVFVNVALHLLNSVLMMMVLLALGMPSRTTAVAGLLFAFGFGHYARQVMWACTSGAIAGVTFSLVSLWATLQLARALANDDASSSDRAWRVALILTSLACALVVHEAYILLPFLLSATVWLMTTRDTQGRIGYPALFIAPAIVWLGILQSFSGDYSAYGDFAASAPGSLFYLFRYLGFMLLPVQYSQWTGAFIVQLILSTALLIASLAMFWRGTRACQLLCVWLYLALLPYCFVNLPERWLQMRYLYHAAMPLCALAATAVAHLYANRALRWRGLAVAAATAMVTGTVALQLVFEHKYDRYAREQASQAPLQAPRSTTGTR